MGKKCIPGFFCIENMTLFILILILFVMFYIYYVQFVKHADNRRPIQPANNTYVILPTPQIGTSYGDPYLKPVDSRNIPMADPYYPPVKKEEYYRSTGGDVRGVPVNVPTRGARGNYQQVGILTRSGRGDEMILPLMGRKITTGTDKWQYYTMTTTGNMNTKLPVSVNGKSCTGEYGCDSINNGDTIYVEGYNDMFRATIYESSLFNYIPFL